MEKRVESRNLGTDGVDGYTGCDGRRLDSLGRPNAANPGEALRASVGWPGIDVAYHFLYDIDLEIAPKASFSYGQAAILENVSTCCGFKLIAGAETRWSFFSQSGFSMAVRGETGLILDLAPVGADQEGIGTGVRISPGIAVDYNATPEVNVVGGFDVPIDILFQYPTTAVIPFLLRTGLEFHPTQKLSVVTLIGIGPGILVSEYTSGGFALNAMIGAGYLF